MLDVWENEPNIDAELLQMVDIGTPHIAGYSLDGKIAGMMMIYNSVCKYFALDPKFGIEDFLPEPAVQELTVEQNTASEQETLSAAVQKIYRINQDDGKLRQILDKPTKGAGAFFDGLRKNYPVRREFQNTRVIVEGTNASLAKKFKGIGFKEVRSEK